MYYVMSIFGLKTCETMTLQVEPEIGIPVQDEQKLMELPDRLDALAKTVEELEKHGLDTTPRADDENVAATLLDAHAQDPEKTKKMVTTKRAATLTPASIQMAAGIVKEFNHSIVDSALQLRHLVTNKLVLESENPDPRVRMRALELLGKISDVGLFTEKSEVTITHQTTDDLKDKLREKLAKLVNPPQEVEEAEIIDAEVDVDCLPIWTCSAPKRSLR
jgi:hypothetical protein